MVMLAQNLKTSEKSRSQREEMARFWAILGLYLSAGLPFWPALEEALVSTPAIAEPIRGLGRAVAQEKDPTDAMAVFCGSIPGPESEMVATMVEHGFRHGISAGDVMMQAQELEDRLAFEQEIRRRQDPLWLTVLPAVMLLNLVMLFGVPMGVMMARSWHGF
jgi:Flp pilus assembly protein TadB